MNIEMGGVELEPIEELKVVVDEDGKKNRRPRNMEKYAPLIFEECFVKTKDGSKMANAFEIDQDPVLKLKANPSNYTSKYKGMHLFVLQHGF